MVALKADNGIDVIERISKEARRILDGLASKWSDMADSKALEVVQLKGAITNEVYQVNWSTMGKGGVSWKVLIWIYGEGVDMSSSTGRTRSGCSSACPRTGRSAASWAVFQWSG